MNAIRLLEFDPDAQAHRSIEVRALRDGDELMGEVLRLPEVAKNVRFLPIGEEIDALKYGGLSAFVETNERMNPRIRISCEIEADVPHAFVVGQLKVGNAHPLYSH